MRPPASLGEPTPALGESQRSPNLASHPPDADETIIVLSWAALGGRSPWRAGLVGVEGGRRYRGAGYPLFPP